MCFSLLFKVCWTTKQKKCGNGSFSVCEDPSKIKVSVVGWAVHTQVDESSTSFVQGFGSESPVVENNTISLTDQLDSAMSVFLNSKCSKCILLPLIQGGRGNLLGQLCRFSSVHRGGPGRRRIESYVWLTELWRGRFSELREKGKMDI